MNHDCNPRWTTCPLAKRIWLQNNRAITRKLRKEVATERGYFAHSKTFRPDKHKTSYTNDALLPIAKKARNEGLYSQKNGLRDIAHSLSTHIEHIFEIRRKWLPDGWKNVDSGLRFKRDRNLKKG